MYCGIVYFWGINNTLKNKVMTQTQKAQHIAFKNAKEIALTIALGCQRRGRDADGKPSNYTGCKMSNGRMFVIGDTVADIQNPCAIIDGKPAREVFGNFSVMYK